MKILFLSHRLPYAPNRGDRVRAFHLLHEISRWAEVDVVSLAHDADEASHAGDLASVVRSVTVAPVPRVSNLIRTAVSLASSRPATHLMLDSPSAREAVDRAASDRKPDLVLSYCTGVAPLAFRPSLAGIPVILDMVDVDSRKWAAMAQSTRFPKSIVYAREARVLRAFEAEAVRQSFATLVVNAREQFDLETDVGGGRIEVIQNGVDVDALRPVTPPSASAVVVFCGVMNYAPNAEGAVWLAREIWPLVRQRHPAAELQIVGASPSPAVKALADPGQGVLVTGAVPDVRPYLWGARVSVAPLRIARGVQNKVLEAVAAGLPVVVTPAVMDGLPGAVKAACVAADSAADFANAITGWLDRPTGAARETALQADVRALTWSRQLARLEELFHEAVAAAN